MFNGEYWLTCGVCPAGTSFPLASVIVALMLVGWISCPAVAWVAFSAANVCGVAVVLLSRIFIVCESLLPDVGCG